MGISRLSPAPFFYLAEVICKSYQMISRHLSALKLFTSRLATMMDWANIIMLSLLIVCILEGFAVGVSLL